MVSWRQMRLLFLLPLFLLGLVAVGWYFSDGKNILSSLPSLPFVSTPTPAPTRQPAVEGATSIVLPDVNPVLHISPMPVSVFSPASAPVDQPVAPASYLDAFKHDYDEYFRATDEARRAWASPRL